MIEEKIINILLWLTVLCPAIITILGVIAIVIWIVDLIQRKKDGD